MPRALLMLFLAVTLAGCAAEKAPQPEALSLVREIKVASLTEALKLTAAAKLACQDPAHCPANVGLYLGATADSVLSCTGFLVGEDLFVTNSHCLPASVVNTPELCAERIRVVLPGAAGLAEESIACKELVLHSARPNALSPDLALLRLGKKHKRPLFTVNPKGIPPQGIFTAHKINPGEGASGLLVTQTDCRAVPDTYRFPLYRNEKDPIFVVGDCASIPGNSGAPLLNGAGEVVGAFQADLALGDAQRKAWTPHLLPGDDFAPLALGTSLQCLDLKSLAWNEACTPVDPETIKRPRIEDFDSAHSATGDALLTPFTAHLPKMFEWERAPLWQKSLEKEESLQPKCFRPTPEWIGAFAIEGGKFHEFMSEATVEAERPLLRAKLFFNGYLQVSPKLEILGSEKVHYTIHPESLQQNGTSLLADGTEERELGLCETSPTTP